MLFPACDISGVKYTGEVLMEVADILRPQSIRVIIIHINSDIYEQVLSYV